MKKSDPKFLYILSARKEYEELFQMEMRHIFETTPNGKYHISREDIDVERSPFIKGKVTILYTSDSLYSIEQDMIEDDLQYDQYKIHFIKYDEVPYQKRLDSMRTLGFAIIGSYAMKDPINEFIITKINGLWIFGILQRNSYNHLNRRKKPHSYSNALDTTLAKALINIAIHNNFDTKVIDPCCGIGTVLIEGRMLGIDITGYEINPLVKIRCNENLAHFHFKQDVEKIDMLQTNKTYDVAILDLPYGQFSFVTKDEQIALLRQTKNIAKKSIIVTMEDMSLMLNSLGFNILSQCQIKKSNAFSRYVTICTQ